MAAKLIFRAAGLTLPCDFVRVASFHGSLRESLRGSLHVSFCGALCEPLRAGNDRQKDAASSPVSTGQGGGVFFGYQELVSINGSGGQVEQQGMQPVGFAQREP
ncbi:hypothetical protein CLAM6_20460 [Cobetia sp. AM6]|nr:hypothetical protein CLAM6_20460 [Cobetia sp. AM6]